MAETILEVKNLKKYFKTARGTLHAVDDVSFTIEKGKTLGIVGESGCGKSTTGRAILRLLEPTDGKVFFEGQDITSLNGGKMRQMRRDMQIIFQDPYASLNPRMTVKELIKAPLDVFSKETEEGKMQKVLEIMKLVGLGEECLQKYPHEFSGGQRQRIVIARALILDPEFIFCDEPVSALDVSVRAQVLNLMKEIQQKKDLTYLFVSHDLSVVRFLCDRIMVMYLGKIVEIGSRENIYDHALHPYTQALLSAIPVADVNVKRQRTLIEGDIPSPYNPPSGCKFHTRCSKASEKCFKDEPGLREIEPGHCVACHLIKGERQNGNEHG